MMALQLKTGDAAYYHPHHGHLTADYCRNFTPPTAVSYGDSGHYLSRLPGPEAMLKPPLSLFTHPQQPFHHIDSLPPLGPPPLSPAQALCPPPIAPAQAMGPPSLGPSQTLGPPPPMTTHTIRPPPIPPGHTLGPPLAHNPPMGPPPIPHHLAPPSIDHTKAIPPPNIDLRPPIAPMGPPPSCFPPLDATQMPPRPPPDLPPCPALMPGLPPGPHPGQAGPGAEQPQDEGSPVGSDEQDDPLGLEELCKPLYCKLCNVTLNSAQQAQAHYQGKNHSKKLRNFYAGSQQPPAIRIPEALEGNGQTSNPSGGSEGDTTRQALYKGATRVILATENDYCKLCDASFSSPAVAQAHYQGKNHAKKLRLAEAQNNNTNNEGNNEVTTRRNRKDEYRLVKNRRSPQLPASVTGPYYNPRPRQRIPRDLAMCVTPSGQFYCSMCNCGAEQEPDFRQHLESKQHKAKVSELRYRNEMETLGYS